MAVSIPASRIVNITPNVLAAGGTGLDLSGLILTNSPRVPIGTVLTFASAASVASFFGGASQEAGMATVYFNGPDNALVRPASLLFAQYAATAVAGYLRGGATGKTLDQVKAITNGTIAVTIDGTPVTSSSINLSGATSFSNAATIIQTALGTGTVTYDSQSGAFVITSGTTGASSSVGYAANAMATALGLTAATGAVISPGAVASVPGTFMDNVVAQTQNFAGFTTTFEPVTADGLAFAAWTNGKSNRYVFVAWDTEAAAYAQGSTTSLGYLVQTANYSGTVLLYEPSDLNHATLVLSYIASLNFDALDGRTTAAFRQQAGLIAGVTNATIADQLLVNGYNFYGAYATANDQFTFLYDGSITGPFLWLDSYINQIWLNNQFQVDLMVLLTNARSVPYNAAGYALIETGMIDTIQQALDFGAIRSGVTLSALQAAEVNAAAGVRVDDVIFQRGWYLSIRDASPTVRIARGSPPMTFFYCDGQSVQSINLNSIEVQ